MKKSSVFEGNNLSQREQVIFEAILLADLEAISLPECPGARVVSSLKIETKGKKSEERP